MTSLQAAEQSTTKDKAACTAQTSACTTTQTGSCCSGSKTASTQACTGAKVAKKNVEVKGATLLVQK